MWIKSLLSKPCIWASLISIIAYWNDTSLHGGFVYDDAGSVAKNVVVNGQVSLSEVLKRDFWGTRMSEPASHKSFRPITTLTFRWNYIWSEMDTYSYHVINVLLHGLVSGLVTMVASYVFREDVIAQFLTGCLFGLHPVHAEVVSNITSRGEMLMSLFYLLAFLSYAKSISLLNNEKKNKYPILSWIGIYVIPTTCMALSLFSKEQGATTLITCVFYDFITNHDSILHYLQSLHKRDSSAIAFTRRTIILAMETLLFCGVRYHVNGETSPDFIVNQNPAGFASDRFVRVFSICWVYCLYVYDAIYPRYLCPDWSGNSIDLIQTWSDVRIVGVLLLWMFAFACLISLIVGSPKKATPHYKYCRRVILLAFFAFCFSPFLLSSNLLVVVGLMKADRVIYLPVLGYCILQALFIKMVCCTGIKKSNTLPNSGGIHWLAYLLILFELALYCGKLHERNLAWSDSLSLWMSAYEVNPRSYHTMYNCGYELSLKQHYELAERVMRPIGSARVDGPSNTFVYAMVLFNLNKCDASLKFVNEALDVIEELKQQGGIRNRPEHLARTTSNLLVAKAHCIFDITERGKILYEAVQVDPMNDYAIQQAQGLMERVALLKQEQGQLQ